MVSFSIPNADSSDADSSLYGVSLYFQSRTVPDSTGAIPTVLSCPESEQPPAPTAQGEQEPTQEASKTFVSPIDFHSVKDGSLDSPKEEWNRTFSVSSDLPRLKDKLKVSESISKIEMKI